VLATGVGHSQRLEINGDRDITVEIATGVVEGRLLSTEGLPVAGATVSLTGEDPELHTTFQGPSARSDDRGAFELPRVAAGTYKVTVRADGFAPAESRVVVTPGGTVHLDVVLMQPGTERKGAGAAQLPSAPASVPPTGF
jgi:carboxypeptidase family protein